jgi:hypothetical protein
MTTLSQLLLLSSCVLTLTAAQTWEHIFIMMFENHGWSQIEHNPYWEAVQEQGIVLTDFYALTHPSQPNYVAQLGGDTFNCNSDAPTNVSASPNLVDLLEAKSITWKSYQEDYTPKPGGDCDPAEQQNSLYYRKHNPFMSYDNVRNNKKRCQNIVPASQLDKDLAANALPQFSYYTPNIKNDAHDTDLFYAGKYLQGWLKKYMAMPNFVRNTMVIITFDEDEYLESNHVSCFLLGPYIKHPNTTEGTKYDHYSITRTIEDNWNLGTMNRKDAKAVNFLQVNDNARPRTAEEMDRIRREADQCRGKIKLRHRNKNKTKAKKNNKKRKL